MYTKRQSQRIVKRAGREVNFYWQGSDLIRSCFDPERGCNMESVATNCYDQTQAQAERSACYIEALDCESKPSRPDA